MNIRAVRIVLGMVGVMAAATANAQMAQEQGSAPTQPGPGPNQAGIGDMPVAPAVQPAMPAPEPYSETLPVMSVGGMTPMAARRIVLGMGQGAAQVFVKINMSKDNAGKPTTVTPDLYYGVTDFLQLGVVHTSPLGWQTPGYTPSSICVTGKSDGCPKLYNNFGIDVLALVVPGPFELAGHARFGFEPLDPFRMNVLLGFVSKLRLPWFAFVLYPSIQIGLNKRDQPGGPTTDGNKEVIYIPGELVFQITPMLALFGQAALYSEAQHFGDHYRIPVGAAALFTVSPMLDLGIRWAWDNVGKVSEGVSRGDERSLVALANLHF